MPRYDYACKNGHVRKDVWVSIANTHLAAFGKIVDITPCLECGEPLEKLPCAPNFTVKGFNAKNGYTKE